MKRQQALTKLQVKALDEAYVFSKQAQALENCWQEFINLYGVEE